LLINPHPVLTSCKAEACASVRPVMRLLPHCVARVVWGPINRLLSVLRMRVLKWTCTNRAG